MASIQYHLVMDRAAGTFSDSQLAGAFQVESFSTARVLGCHLAHRARCFSERTANAAPPDTLRRDWLSMISQFCCRPDRIEVLAAMGRAVGLFALLLVAVVSLPEMGIASEVQYDLTEALVHYARLDYSAAFHMLLPMAKGGNPVAQETL